jgi:hypothetical protein
MSQEWIERTIAPGGSANVHVHIRDGIRLILLERQRLNEVYDLGTVLDRAIDYLRDRPAQVFQVRQATLAIQNIPNQRLGALIYLRDLRQEYNSALEDPIEDSENSAAARYFFSMSSVRSETEQAQTASQSRFPL